MGLDNRIKELIAAGASVSANCQPCFEYHVRQALENGASDQDVAEAVQVGKSVRRGAAAKMDEFASSLGQAASDGGPAPR